jgi:hypothetical protein
MSNEMTKIRDDMWVWGLTSAGENALERRDGDAGIEENNEGYEGKEGRGDIRRISGSSNWMSSKCVGRCITPYKWRVIRCRKWHRSQKPAVEIRFVRVKPAFLNGVHKKSERELNDDFEGKYNRLKYS